MSLLAIFEVAGIALERSDEVISLSTFLESTGIFFFHLVV
jgi:hypothetical protein